VCFIYVLRTPEYRVAGFCAFWLVADQAHINQLAVWPELRSRGLGTQLIEAVIAEAAHLGATELTLEVRASNEAALRLYNRAGFQRAGVRKNYYTSPIEDAYILIRSTVKTHS
jgi:ribosomal-protein-alanine N-acetyltransferase